MENKIEELYKNSEGFLKILAEFEKNGKVYTLLINKKNNDYDLYCLENNFSVYSHKSFKDFIKKLNKKLEMVKWKNGN